MALDQSWPGDVDSERKKTEYQDDQAHEECHQIFENPIDEQIFISEFEDRIKRVHPSVNGVSHDRCNHSKDHKHFFPLSVGIGFFVPILYVIALEPYKPGVKQVAIK